MNFLSITTSTKMTSTSSMSLASPPLATSQPTSEQPTLGAHQHSYSSTSQSSTALSTLPSSDIPNNSDRASATLRTEPSSPNMLVHSKSLALSTQATLPFVSGLSPLAPPSTARSQTPSGSNSTQHPSRRALPPTSSTRTQCSFRRQYPTPSV